MSANNFTTLKYIVREMLKILKMIILYILILATTAKTIITNEDFRGLEKYQFNDINETFKTIKSKDLI
jgi:hypothetical protein